MFLVTFGVEHIYIKKFCYASGGRKLAIKYLSM